MNSILNKISSKIYTEDALNKSSVT